MPTHRLSIADGAHAAVPGTTYRLRLEALRHRTASSEPGTPARSMLTATVVLLDGAREIADRLFVDGQRARLGPLQVTLLGEGDERSSALLEVTTTG